jgi:hypothetical protein
MKSHHQQRLSMIKLPRKNDWQVWVCGTSHAVALVVDTVNDGLQK